MSARVVDRPELRDRTRVFRDRDHAGEVLAEMLDGYRGSGALVLAVPAGGVPVAARVADVLGLELDVVVVSKVTVPWDTEAGYGAVAFDGTERMNDALVRGLRLSAEEVRRGVAASREKVQRRVRELRAGRGPLEVQGRDVVLVDDGLASGFTMLVALDAVRRAGARRVTVAVPTGHRDAAAVVAQDTDGLYCANLRGGRVFAVAEAYRAWSDVAETEAKTILTERRSEHGH